MKKEEVQHLARLSRIALSDGEEAAYAKEFDAILGYVAQVADISGDTDLAPSAGALSNVLRADEPNHAPGAYTEALLAAAPDRDGAYVRVKKVLSHNDEE